MVLPSRRDVCPRPHARVARAALPLLLIACCASYAAPARAQGAASPEADRRDVVHRPRLYAPVLVPAEPAGEEAAATSLYTFSTHERHPDFLFQPYTAGPLLANPLSKAASSTRAFRALLDQYVQRQGVDDNFTIRVTNSRTGELVELYELQADRARYEREGEADWGAIDRKRRDHTRRLLDKHAARGIPRGVLSARWGRANQIREARDRERPHIEYEINLARYLGLSLLATEIGTVETFNDDRLVSSAGARGRYQMMPYLLKQTGINRYSLRTASGGTVSVVEEWNPLLTMEPSFVTLRGYVNAVGHEIPGISAYHTGPGNIYRVYRLFLEQARGRLNAASTVVDAYMWAVTDGFDVVSKGSSFGSYSRGYVASAYGSLRAAEAFPIDPNETMLTERVRLRPGRSVQLSELLRSLDAVRHRLHLRGTAESLYTVFREMNPHIALPASSGAVPVRGDVRLVRSAGNAPVRFFLPLGSTEALAEAGVTVLDDDATFRFDRDTYAPPADDEVTQWDRAYARLVEETSRFGFTRENRAELRRLAERFEQLAEARPHSHYRQIQRAVIDTHLRLWESNVWETLADAATPTARRLAAERHAAQPAPDAPDTP